MLPGKTLVLTNLNAKKFRNKGNKDGALKAFRELASEGLGKIYECASSRGVAKVYRFVVVIGLGVLRDFFMICHSAISV